MGLDNGLSPYRLESSFLMKGSEDILAEELGNDIDLG